MVEEVREQAGGVMSVGSVVAHFLTDLVCLMMAEQCPGDAGVCAQRTRVIVQFVEGLLVAKVLVADGFREHARRKEEGVC